MKRFLIVTALFFISSAVFAQRSADKDLVLEALDQQTKTWNSGDILKYMQGFAHSDSLIYVGNSGLIYGWDNTLKHYQKSYPNPSAMGTLYYEIKNLVMIDHKNAFVVGAWRLKREKDEPKGYFTKLYKKIDNTWLVVANHVK